MNQMIGLVYATEHSKATTHCLQTLAASYGVPLCAYNIMDLEPDRPTVPARVWENGKYQSIETEIPTFSDMVFGRLSFADEPEFVRRNRWLQEHTTVVDNPGVLKSGVSALMMQSSLAPYAIPTYKPNSYEELMRLLSLLPRAIVKPVGGCMGIGVYHITRRGSTFVMEGSKEQKELTPTQWEEYVALLKEKKFGAPILQPRLDFSFDEKHTVDFRLLVARGGSGDWETVDIYPRIGSNRVVSNVSQGGFIGDAMEVLAFLSREKAMELLADLKRIAAELPPLLQAQREKPIAVLGIDVGIDRESLQPFVLEANTKPGTKFHLWKLAEKKVQYYQYLLSRAKSEGKENLR